MQSVELKNRKMSIASKNLLVWNVSKKISDETDFLMSERDRRVSAIAQIPYAINFIVDGEDIGNTILYVSTPEYLPEVFQHLGLNAEFVTARVIRITMWPKLSVGYWKADAFVL